jgi:hypothetical protein
MPVRIYDREKTLTDCFRDRNQLGMEVVLEALRLWRERHRKKLDVLVTHARATSSARCTPTWSDAVTIKNLAASVQARLQNHARATKRPFQELLQYHAMERFLYRLSKAPYRARFVRLPTCNRTRCTV